jgi:arginyl-tRNA synthetase
VLAPLPAARKGVAIGCGCNPKYGDLDPYWMAASAIDEALRNVVAVGADPERTAEAVGLGAVVFASLATRRNKDVDFDWGRIVKFEGDTGPYLQYTHARLSSILRKAGREVGGEVDYALLDMPEEWTLVRHLEQFPAVVQRAAEQCEPSVVASYLLALCADFSSYYSAGMREPELRVLCGDEALSSARLALVQAARHVIGAGLKLLGVAAPERM